MIRALDLILCISLFAVTVTSDNDSLIEYRLPKNTLPIRYDIELNTRIDDVDFEFAGNVKIRLLVLTGSNTITVHAKQLTIVRTELRDSGGRLLGIQPVTVDNVTDFLTVQTTGELLAAGQEYLLEIAYAGTLRTDNLGFYRSSYVDDENQTM